MKPLCIGLIRALVMCIPITPVICSAATSATSNLSANILQGECTTNIDSGAEYNLGSISMQSVTSTSDELLTGPPVEVIATCTGSSNVVPMMKFSPAPGTTAIDDGTYFRNNTKSTSQTALAIRFRFLPIKQQLGGGTWTPYIDEGTYGLSDRALDINGSAITGSFSIWCKPQSGQTWQDCAAPQMKVVAGFEFEIFYP